MWPAKVLVIACDKVIAWQVRDRQNQIVVYEVSRLIVVVTIACIPLLSFKLGPRVSNSLVRDGCILLLRDPSLAYAKEVFETAGVFSHSFLVVSPKIIRFPFWHVVFTIPSCMCLGPL